MNWNELLNPWAALRKANLEIRVLRREQEMLVGERDRVLAHNTKLLADLKKAQKNDNRGPDGKFKKGGK